MNLKFDIKSLLKSKKKPADGEAFEPHSSEGHKKFKQVAIWIKAHIVVLVLSVISISALAAAYTVSLDLFVSNEEKAAANGKKLDDMAKFERTPVSIVIPGNDPVTGNILVNRKFVEVVKSRMSRGISDGSDLMQSALKHNKGSHRPIMSLRLAAGDAKLQQIHLDMHDKLQERYSELLTQCRAALPPAEEDVLIELQRSKLRFVQAELSKSIEMKLTSEEQAKLVDDLTNRRLAAYRDVAVNSGLYLDGQSIGAPTAPLSEVNMEQLWFMQWKYWIAEDIVRACSKLNEGASIATGPVKRIIAIQFHGSVGSVASASGGDASGETATAPPDGEGGSVPSNGVPIDPNALVSLSNYTVSFQGWGSNQLYDVFRTTVTLVVETAKIPLLTNALAQQNFIAITNVRMLPVDPFAAIQSGYFYGENPVSTVTLTLESVWLRQWTGPLMPDQVRAKFGTTGQVQSALSPVGDTAASPSSSQE